MQLDLNDFARNNPIKVLNVKSLPNLEIFST